MLKISLILILVTSLALAEDVANKYTLTVTDANHHLAEVVAEFSNIKTKSFEVKLPAWRTGRYEILDLAKNIRQFSVFDVNNKSLTWHKVNKNTWKIFVNRPGTIKVKYQIYANQLKDRVSHIDATHAFLDASGIFVYSESQRHKKLTVKLNVAEQWKSVSGMETIGLHQFQADNYDQLVDSPIESGLHYFDSMEVDEQVYEIVIWGEGNFDIDRIKQDITKLHHQAKLIWKTFPFKRYVFMYHAGDNLRGATEHVNSTIIQIDRLGFYPDKSYRRVIAVTAHEFVHTWNVKSYRPAGISPYDYGKENYSDLFWMAEGSTSFYDNLIAVRSKIFSIEDFLGYLLDDINEYSNKPGRKVMSLAESSFDTWLKNDKNRSHNSTVSIYLKGSLVTWLLDKEIRKRTDNRKSMDDLSLLLYKRYSGNKNGYTSYNVKQLLKKITNTDFTKFWQDYVEGTKAIDFEELLAFYGLQFESDKGKDKLKASLGMITKNNNGRLTVTQLDTDGPAWLAGLTAEDTLIAINGYQIDEKNLKKHIENLTIDNTYPLHYFHQGVLKQTQITPIKALPEGLKLMPLNKPSYKQKQHFEGWTKISIEDAFKTDK